MPKPAKTIDYYFTVVSPWSYLGHDRLVAIAARHGATIAVKPVDLLRIFPVSGGLPLPQRAPQRLAYRLVELRRWSDYLAIPINVQPKHAASPPDLAAKWILAAAQHGSVQALALSGAIMRARWAEERDVADPATLAEVAAAKGLDAVALAADAATAGIAARYDALTQEAIDRQVFGAPTYVCDGELFWGQDRLDFLDRKLAQ
jgi:2-hydroxychromene-2-carboxylate isomerase